MSATEYYREHGEADFEFFEYLDELRDSGVTNMLGAPAYLQSEFGVNKQQSFDIWERWKESFAERHAK